MQALMIITLATAIALAPSVVQAQQTLAAEAEASAFKALAASIPLGSRIKVQARTGRRMTATLMSVQDNAIIVKRESRIPEAAVSIPYSELTRLHLDDKSGFSFGKAVGVGLAAGVGAILTLFAIAVSIDD